MAVWLPILLLPPLFLWALQSAQRIMPTRDVIDLTQAQFQPVAEFDITTLPAAWQPTTLPHRWRGNHDDIAEGMYRVELNLRVAPDRLWGLFVPRHAMTASIYMNGELLATGGRHHSPLPRYWNKPLLISIPNGLLRPGENELIVRVSAEPAGSGLLRELYAGPYESLTPYQRWHEILRVAIPFACALLLATMALFMGVLWWVRRHDTVYFWYGLALLLWGAHCLNLFIVDILVPTWLWEWLRYVTFGWVVMLTALFVNRFLGEKPVPIERMLFAVGIAGAAVLLPIAAFDEPFFYGVAVRVWYLLAVVSGVYTASRLVKQLRLQPNAEMSLLLASGATMLLCGARDWLVFTNRLPPWDGLFVHYTALPVMLVFCVILFRRFVNAMRQAESLNVELERRVADKHAELERNYERLRQMERQNVLADERARIMRDMHDGVGGHMISTVALIESGRTTLPEIALSMRAAIEDLRLMIDSLDPEIDSVATALRLLRSRLEPRLRSAGVESEWHIEDVPGLTVLNPQSTLNLLRIVQEAINNALRHSQATQLRILATASGHSAVIEVRDNGKGMRAIQEDALKHAQAPAGRGLANMRKRAQLLGAHLEIASNPGGVCVRLVL